MRPAIAISNTAVPNAPDWDMKAMGPAGGVPGANEALSGVAVSITPRQLGPIKRKS